MKVGPAGAGMSRCFVQPRASGKLAKRPFRLPAIPSAAIATRVAMGVLGAAGRRSGRFARLPLAGGWTKHRDMPAPAGPTFMALYREKRRKA